MRFPLSGDGESTCYGDKAMGRNGDGETEGERIIKVIKRSLKKSLASPSLKEVIEKVIRSLASPSLKGTDLIWTKQESNKNQTRTKQEPNIEQVRGKYGANPSGLFV